MMVIPRRERRLVDEVACCVAGAANVSAEVVKCRSTDKCPAYTLRRDDRITRLDSSSRSPSGKVFRVEGLTVRLAVQSANCPARNTLGYITLDCVGSRCNTGSVGVGKFE